MAKKRSAVRVLAWSGAIFFVVLLVAAATLWTVTDRAGQSFWTRVQAELVADGEATNAYDLHVDESAGPHNKTLSNYGTIPILQDISEPWGKPNRERLESIILHETRHPSIGRASSPALPAADLNEWADSLWKAVKEQRALPRQVRSIQQDFPTDDLPTADAASRITTYLNYWSPTLAELHQGTDRDVAFFEPAIEEREKFPEQRWMPHLAGISRASLALYLHAVIAARSGDRDELILNLQTLSRLAEACANEHQLSAHYEATRIMLMLETGIAEGFQSGLLQKDPEALRKCIAMLQRVDLHSAFGPALRDDILETTALIGACSTDQGRADAFPEGTSIPILAWLPPGWFQNQQGVYLGLANAHLFKGLREGACLGDQIETAKRFNSTLTGSLNRSHLLIALFTPLDGMHYIYYLPTYSEAYRRMGMVAIALQLYAIDHEGKAPTSLNALVPDHLDKIPNDPMDGAPLRYALNTNGSYRLWSIALDRIDNKGHLNLTPNRSTRVDPSFHTYTGDWPWPTAP